MKTLPEGLVEIGEVMSNFDGVIEEDAEFRLMNEPSYGAYSAWEFWGAVWFEDGQFHCMIKRYCRHIDTISADSLQEIMDIACDRHGRL